ncbi:MAG: hypothetical protein O7G87_15600, partial [bacterium]|nr:hypothetical protein [bacterium]
KVPTGIEDSDFAEAGVYVNEDWQFQITRPDETWGMNASVSALIRQANGLPRVEVWMLGPPESDAFQPTFYLTPDALFQGDSPDSFLADLELELSSVFAGYAPEEKQKVRLDGGEMTYWVFETAFSSRENFLPGTRFWVQTVSHGSEVFIMLGNGSSDYFPVNTYERIASSLKFLD